MLRWLLLLSACGLLLCVLCLRAGEAQGDQGRAEEGRHRGAAVQHRDEQGCKGCGEERPCPNRQAQVIHAGAPLLCSSAPLFRSFPLEHPERIRSGRGWEGCGPDKGRGGSPRRRRRRRTSTRTPMAAAARARSTRAGTSQGTATGKTRARWRGKGELKRVTRRARRLCPVVCAWPWSSLLLGSLAFCEYFSG